MKKIGSLVLKSLIFLVIANFDVVNAQASPQPVTEAGEKTNSSTHTFLMHRKHLSSVPDGTPSVPHPRTAKGMATRLTATA